MSIYAVDKLMTETRRLASEYYKTTGQVLPVSSELSRYDVIQKLKFLPIEKPEKGVDLLGSGPWKDKKALIKSRVIFENSKSKQRVGQLNMEGGWEVVILVLMNEAYEPFEMYLIDRPTIESTLSVGKESSRRQRGALSVAKFKALGTRVWSLADEKTDDVNS